MPQRMESSTPRASPAIASGRKHERRTTGRDRDPDARFSAKRSRARDSAARGGDLGAGGVVRALPRDSERAVLVALAIAEAIAA